MRQIQQVPLAKLSDGSASKKQRIANGLLIGIATVVAVTHLLTNGRYGIHRDELQFLNDAVHLGWGFVAFPPFTPFVERVSLMLFGHSLVGLRLFSVVAQCTVIWVSGLMARELGGGRLAQISTALAVALSPLALFEGTEFQYTSFDFLWWVVIAWCVIRLLRTENPRWWLAVGAAMGLALMTKYTVVFYGLAVIAGFLLTGSRRMLANRWFLGGIGLALAICLPNLIWQAQHNFISLRFLEHIHARDIGEGRYRSFLKDQFLICTNVIAAPLWIAGLAGFFRERRFRPLAWMFLLPLMFFWMDKGRGYYTAAVYPMAVAMGAVLCARWAEWVPHRIRTVLTTIYLAVLVAFGVVVSVQILPYATSGWLKAYALSHNSNLREEIGWNQMVRTVAGIRDHLPAEERANVGILVGNYGEAGAIQFFGPSYGLPSPISGTNTAWYWSYPKTPPSALIVLGFSQDEVTRTFEGCRLAGHNGNREGVANEESTQHPDIFVCGRPRESWPEFWQHFERFG